MSIRSPRTVDCHLVEALKGARLTDLTQKGAPWVRAPEEENYFQVLKDKIASARCLGVPRPHGNIILASNSCNPEEGGDHNNGNSSSQKSAPP